MAQRGEFARVHDRRRIARSLWAERVGRIFRTILGREPKWALCKQCAFGGHSREDSEWRQQGRTFARPCFTLETGLMRRRASGMAGYFLYGHSLSAPARLRRTRMENGAPARTCRTRRPKNSTTTVKGIFSRVGAREVANRPHPEAVEHSKNECPLSGSSRLPRALPRGHVASDVARLTPVVAV